MVGKGVISGRFWWSAEWIPYCCSARHIQGSVVNWVVLSSVRHKHKLMEQRRKQGGNQYFSV